MLEKYSTPDAEFDSMARHPAPKCHPGTRRHQRAQIEAWLLNQERDQNILWLHGCAGVGKTAIAQTIAEKCVEIDRLGATFFFSRPKHRDDPARVIPTLASQLAARNPDYKQIIAKQLENNPGVLHKTPRIQFNVLMVEPFTILRDRIQQPLLVILDGLDECAGEAAQKEFIELIIGFDNVAAPGTLLWMVCSRPEAHLKRAFSRKDIKCWKEEISPDGIEAMEDVTLFLRDGFQDIREQFPECIPESSDEPWPSQQQLDRIVRASAGLFVFAFTALKFVGDPDHANPQSQLHLLLVFIDKFPVTGEINPLEALDSFYAQILSEIPSTILPTTLLLLGVARRILPPWTFDATAKFLGLDQGTCYSALRKLHSVLKIPQPDRVKEEGIGFYHVSFEDYLEDRSRSRAFYPFTQKFWKTMFVRALHWWIYYLEHLRSIR